MMIRKKIQPGFSIVEVVISLGIITMGLLGVVSLAVQSIQVKSMNKNYLVGSLLAQEGLELVRNIRDSNWLIPGNTWKTDLADASNDGTFAIDYRASIDDTPNNVTDAGAKLYFKNNYYAHDPTGTDAHFSRLITITDSGNHLAASSTVLWYDRGVHTYTAETYFFDWR
jgi:Tfp pilus assembly protein PilV